LREALFTTPTTLFLYDGNSHLVRENHYQQFGINMWAGIVNNDLIGVSLLPRGLNDVNYSHLLEHNLPELPEDVPLAIRQDIKWSTTTLCRSG
jgi:hypothetical protein